MSDHPITRQPVDPPGVRSRPPPRPSLTRGREAKMSPPPLWGRVGWGVMSRWTRWSTPSVCFASHVGGAGKARIDSIEESRRRPVAAAAEEIAMIAPDPQWYKDAIIYELHVKAFADSNDDGIGDFPGLNGKLDYLQDLGINCIWL